MTQQNGQSDNQDTEQDDQDSLEEPTIGDGEPQTPQEFTRDSEPDPFTVDDGLLATDSDEPTPGSGWLFNG
ncbi:hypothetical protein [Rhodococcoides fascians]|uniref:hypothetical protein n=1 Tax=Rhodococcoides fascians TaxID=1828 RepID=UPI0009B9151D|nr:hypothetical protein [Rhodococcus fascians]